MDRAQNLPGPAPNNLLRVLQISSNSVHFQRSYSQMREHRQTAPQSESNIWPKPSSELNNQAELVYMVRLRYYTSAYGKQLYKTA